MILEQIFYKKLKEGFAIKALYLLLVLIPFAAGCSSSDDRSQEQPPDLEGTLEEVSYPENTVLISGSGELSDKDTQLILSVTSESKIVDHNNKNTSLDDIKQGIRVQVWVENGEVLDTEPRQGVLELLKVIGE